MSLLKARVHFLLLVGEDAFGLEVVPVAATLFESAEGDILRAREFIGVGGIAALGRSVAPRQGEGEDERE
jgi:hypothetical protein